MDSRAVVAVTLQQADPGDTTTVKQTLAEAGETVAELIEQEAVNTPDQEPRVHLGGIEELVGDKDYHSAAVLTETKDAGVRTYIPERKQTGRRNWQGKQAQQKAAYNDRRRNSGSYAKGLLRKRGDCWNEASPTVMTPVVCVELTSVATRTFSSGS